MDHSPATLPRISKERLALIKSVVPEPMKEEEFNKLTRSEKAVMVARDALAMLRHKLMNATHAYVDIKDVWGSVIGDNTSATSLEGKCELFTANKCHVCAKGALFMSTVMHTNKMTIGEIRNHRLIINNEYVSEKVCNDHEIFSQDMFDEIENAYEGSYRNEYDFIEKEEDFTKPHMKNYYKKFTKSRERLAAILINIIRNKGEFIPTKIVKPSDVKRALTLPKARK